MLPFIVRIDYKYVAGQHIFASKDIEGLLVVSGDAEVAHRDVAPSIKKLLLMNNGIECEIQPAVPFKDFIARVTHKKEHADTPLTLSNQEYCLSVAA